MGRTSNALAVSNRLKILQVRQGTLMCPCRMQTLVEDFLQHLRHERGQAEHTQRTYSALLNKFVAWGEKQGLSDWKAVELEHLISFLEHERERSLANVPKESTRRLSGESV